MATAAAAATDWGGWVGAPPDGPPMADVATRVFKLAPFWVYASAWHMERYSAQPSISFSSAIRGDDMLRLYRDRQLKGSNLIVGLTQGAARTHSGAVGPCARSRGREEEELWVPSLHASARQLLLFPACLHCPPSSAWRPVPRAPSAIAK